MPDNFGDKPIQNQRIYFRIPAKLPAQIFINGRFYKKVLIEDISIGGVGFSAKDELALPDLFELRMRLPGHFKPIKMMLEARYKREVDGILRYGCLYADLSEKDENMVSGFMNRFIEFSLPCRLLSMASFLLLIDALCRRFCYALNSYYIEVKVGESSATDTFYGIVLAVYTIAAFLACIHIDNIKKKRFLLGFFCAAGAFLFLFYKNITYLGFGFWRVDHLFVITYLRIQVVLLGYVGLAIFAYTFSLKKINFIANSIDLYWIDRKRSESQKMDGGPA
ncbi:MAG: PilZ domain-containing protein [Candidatus Omnitrophica bacterium]|nr:PilZ domain-containing protein [Candidatus Omnitrophota bacterium]